MEATDLALAEFLHIYGITKFVNQKVIQHHKKSRNTALSMLRVKRR